MSGGFATITKENSECYVIEITDKTGEIQKIVRFNHFCDAEDYCHKAEAKITSIPAITDR